MDRITSTALCQYRENKANESHEHFNRYSKLIKIDTANRTIAQTHEIHIALHKALIAADDAKEAHKLVCGDKHDSVINEMLPGLFLVGKYGMSENVREHLADKIEDAYEYFENRMEDAALSKFHRDAFGE